LQILLLAGLLSAVAGGGSGRDEAGRAVLGSAVFDSAVFGSAVFGSAVFDSVAAKAARAALSGVRTADLAGHGELDGRVTRMFASQVVDQALQSVATAQQDLVQTPPGAAEVGTRDGLLRLLTDAARVTGDLVGAVRRGDDTATRAAVDALGPIGDRLAAFVAHHR
jgi:hypothetical protein